MAVNLVKGQKVDLTKGNEGLLRVRVGLGWDTNSKEAGPAFDLDASAFLLEANGKTKNEKDFVFYNNLQGRNACVIHTGDNLTGEGEGDDEQLVLDFTKVPKEIARIAFTVTIHDAQARKQNFGLVENAYVRVLNADTGDVLLRYDLGQEFSVETAIVVCEIYRFKEDWKFAAVGSGFQGGLDALCEHFGLKVAEGSSSTPDSEPKPEIKPVPKEEKRPEPKPEKKTVELRKGQKVNLDKTVSQGKTDIIINLNWNQTTGNKGLLGNLFGGSQVVDLDLGCLFELEDGQKGVVQALGNCFGSLDQAPYISLDGDDRTGSNQAGENLRIHASMMNRIKRVLVFTFIYQGAAKWSEVDGVVTVYQPAGGEIVIRMDEHRDGKNMCALALIESGPQGEFSIEKIVRYYPSHKEMDQDFKWGLNWVPGKK